MGFDLLDLLVLHELPVLDLHVDSRVMLSRHYDGEGALLNRSLA